MLYGLQKLCLFCYQSAIESFHFITSTITPYRVRFPFPICSTQSQHRRLLINRNRTIKRIINRGNQPLSRRLQSSRDFTYHRRRKLIRRIFFQLKIQQDDWGDNQLFVHSSAPPKEIQPSNLPIH